MGKEGDYFKEFSSSKVVNLTHKKLNNTLYTKIKARDKQQWFAPNFDFEFGYVDLAPNVVYCIKYINENRDLVLPKKPNHTDWVSLWHEQTTVIKNLTMENKRPIKIYGNGQRIMGLDEPLICDVEFQTLKLVFLDDVQGWIIV